MIEPETFAQQWERASPPPFRGITWAEHDAMPRPWQSAHPFIREESPHG